LLNASSEIQRVPLDLVRVSVEIPGAETVSRQKIELPHVLSHGVAPDSPSGAELDMVVHHTIINHRARVLVFVPPRAKAGWLGPSHFFHGRFMADEVIDRQLLKEVA
jgi:hypothetical protein